MLLGGFELRLASGGVVDLPGQKDRALLAVLALRPGTTLSRDRLSGLLWSDRGDAQARDSLKHSLTRLRQCLAQAGPPPITADRQSVRLDPGAVAVDVVAFEQLLRDSTMDALERAAALYRGDLLDGIGAPDPSFEDWLGVERQRLRQAVEEALSRLMTQSMAAGARDRAATAARRLLTLDPLREAACRILMQIEAERAQTAQALKLYEALHDRLHRELGVKPEAATMQLYESIRQRRSGLAAPAPISVETPAQPGPAPAELPLPSRPSIAVLPFLNLSGDPEQEYFADGMAEEIITALSRMRWLMVIARNSSFTYKGRPIDVKQVGRELGVHYVLEGSVRKAGSKVRIAGELIDTSTGGNLWADRFDGGLEDIFDLQDKVAASVVGAIVPRLEQAEIERAKRKPTEDLSAYDLYLRGVSVPSWTTREANDEALRFFNQAIERDPAFALAYARAASCYRFRKSRRWMLDLAQEVSEAARLARCAVQLGRDDAVALSYAGLILAYVVGDLDDGGAFVDRALALNSNLAAAWAFSGWMKVCFGEPETGIEHEAMAVRLSPLDPLLFEWKAILAIACMCAGRLEEATAWSESSLRDEPNFAPTLRVAAATYGLVGRLEEAQKIIARLYKLDPSLRLSEVGEVLPPFRRQQDRAKFVEGLRKAGLLA